MRLLGDSTAPALRMQLRIETLNALLGRASNRLRATRSTIVGDAENLAVVELEDEIRLLNAEPLLDSLLAAHRPGMVQPLLSQPTPSLSA